MNKLLIKIPTRERGFKWLPSYLDNIVNPNTKIIISIDEDDKQPLPKKMNGIERVHFVIGESKSKIHAINRDIKGNDFDVLLVGSDDMIPQVKGFDQIILDDMKENYPNRDGCLWYHTEDHQKELRRRYNRAISPGSPDFYRKWICMLPVMGRAYYNRFNYVFHPDYVSFWCDNEFTDVANRFKKITYLHKRIIKHIHPAWDPNGNPDDLYSRNNPNFTRDMQTYNRRKALGFPQSIKV